MIEIYNPNNKNFDMNGDITLTPLECKYTVESNVLYEVQIIHPYDKLGRWKYIKEDAVLKGPLPNGKSGLFKVLKPSKNLDNITANCVPVAIYELGKKVLPSTVKIVNKNGQQALDIILKGTKYKGHSDIEANNNCNFFKNNIMQAIAGEQDNTFLKRWGGELKLEGYDIYINSKPSGSTRVAYGFNMQEIELERDMSNLVTRIYPYVTLETTNTIDLPEGHIDSPLINKYSQVYEVYMDFSEYMHLKTDDEDNSDNAYATKGELYDAMRARCLALFNQGIDKPTVSGSVSASVLKNTLEFKGFEGILNIDQGYLVKIEHTDIGIETEERCSGFVWDMIEEDFLEVKIGINKENSFDLQSDLVNKADYILNPNGTVDSAKLEGIIDALSTKFIALRNTAQQQHVRAMLFQDKIKGSKTFGAICLGSMGFEIASEMNSSGDWIWRTFGTGQGFFADQLVGKLKTVLIENMDGSFSIDLNKPGGADFKNNGQLAMRMQNNMLQLFNWNQNSDLIGGLVTLNRDDDNGNPIANMPLASLLHEKNAAVTIDYRTEDNKSKSYVEFDKYNILKSKNTAPIRLNESVEMADNNIYNAHFKANKATPFYINNKEVMLLNEDKIFFYVPVYNSKGKLVLDPNAPQGDIYNDDDNKKLIDKLIKVAKSELGKPYVYGATGPDSFDCSGLMQYCFKKVGISIGRTTYDQVREGQAVSQSELEVGDLVFPSADHVGIYIGNNQIIHAPHTGDVVKISTIWAFYKARRIIKSNNTTPVNPGKDGDLNGTAKDYASPNMIYFTKFSEGFASKPYDDGAGTMTIGYGLIGKELQQAESMGLPLSESNATKLLVKYINSNYYKPVYNIIKSKGVTPTWRECDCFCDFAFNEGVEAFQDSTLLTVYVEYVKSGRKDSSQVHAQLLRWIYAGGGIMQGLKTRRENEYRIMTGQKVAGYDTIADIQNITNGGVIKNGGTKPY